MKNLFLLLIIVLFNACSNSPTIDRDMDGVNDNVDACKKTPKYAMVDKYGCALDSDMDGVIDVYDKCPNTPFSKIVNRYGCPIK